MSEILQTNSQDQEDKNLALLLWIGTIFFSFVPGLLFYLLKKDSHFVTSHTKEALNWSITACIGYLVASALTVILIGVFLYPIIWLCNLLFCIFGALAASKGEGYQVPWAIRLIK